MTKIIQRHDTAANWASVNPVLAQGEMGIEDDTHKFKFGDGTTAWTDLAYASSEGGGGGGTSDYNELTNKPTIESTELKGELSLAGALKIERASTDAFYNSSRNANKQLSFSKASGYLNYNTGNSYISGTAGIKINNDGTITPSSYFMIPYKLGDVIVSGLGDDNRTYFSIHYGYKIDGKFRPVISSVNRGSSRTFYWNYLNLMYRYATTYYKNEQLYTKTDTAMGDTYKDTTTYPERDSSSLHLSSLIYDESLGVYKMYNTYSTSDASEYQYDTRMNELLQKVDTVMVCTKSTITSASIYASFDIKDRGGSMTSFFTDITYPELMALPSIEVPEVIEHNVLSTGNIPNSYGGLDDKPKLNGIELNGNINSTDLNIQRVLTPNGGVKIVQNGDWHFFDASYDDTTKQVTFDRYNMCKNENNNSTTFSYALNSTSTSASKIGTYVDTEKIIPTCGVITPFYKNVTWKFGYNNTASSNRLVFGNYIDGYFYPKYIICPPYVHPSTASDTFFQKISKIISDQANVFQGTNVKLSRTSNGTYRSPTPVAFITILYDNNTYIFKCSHTQRDSDYYYIDTLTVTDDTEGLNLCTHCWYIPNTSSMGMSAASQLATGDWSNNIKAYTVDNIVMNDALILPDSGSNVFTTSISVKTDGITTKINEKGELEAIAPANMITSENIASDATIVGMNDAIKMAQGDITTLSTTVESNTTKIVQIETYPKVLSGSGKILDANGDTTEGVGTFTLTLYNNGQCRLDFAIKITTAGTNSSNFDWGISVTQLKGINSNIPNITTASGGCAIAFGADGIKSDKYTEYGGRLLTNESNTRWIFARLYDTAGTVGTWPSSRLEANAFLYGFAVGTFNINEV